MDLLKHFLDPNVPLEKKRIRVKTAPVKVLMKSDYDDENALEEFNRELERNRETDYAREYQLREQQLYAESVQLYKNDGDMSQVDRAEYMLSVTDREEIERLKEDQLVEVYTKYPFNKKKHQRLTIEEHRSQILSFLYTNQVIVIQGPTGCGKTTQVPQFILDDCRSRNKHCKIIVTQPRRIAAISIARRVCEEREWALGTVCGYQVGLENQTSRDTILSYVTTGILLQKLIKQKNLHEFTHIIIDEVHERNQDMDFLLLIIRKFLYTSSANVKVILMSATFNAEGFAYYFRTPSRNSVIEAPIINIAKRNFDTLVYHVEQLTSLGEMPNYNISEPKIDPCLYKLCTYLIRTFDRLDPQNSITNETIIGHVLVFLPGILEIEEMHRHLEMKKNWSLVSSCSSGDSSLPKIKWEVLPLHSSVTTEEQRRIFLPPKPGIRKIILSTNIAESSITVPDIYFVIDFCLTKTMVMDSRSQYQSLQLQWASKVNCKQREGRVGRVGEGRVYRLVPSSFFQNELPKNITPEIARAPLDRVVLATKLLDLSEPPKAILALAMDPPDLANIEFTIWNLKEAGGLLMTRRGEKMVSDGDLTFLGQVMASLPLDIHLSKLIVLGHMFSCLDDCIIMACGMSLNKIFSTPFMAYLRAYTNRLQWADGSCSDLIAYLNLYKVWQKKRRQSFRSKEDERKWAESNFISIRALKEWEHLVIEVRDRVHKMGIKETLGAERVRLSDIELPIVIKVIICGAFYPNYFRRSADAGQIDEREAVKVLGGHDPCNTVYFTNFDPYQPGPLYAQRIKEIFTQHQIVQSLSDIQVTFDSSSKVYVTFINNKEPMYALVDNQQFVTKMPGKIAVEVYRAVRMRQLNIGTSIKVLKSNESWKIAQSYGIDTESQRKGYVNLIKKNRLLDQPILPSLHNLLMRIKVSEVIDAGHFWVQHADHASDSTLEHIFKLLNGRLLKKVEPKDLQQGEIYAAQYKVDNCFYRCKILGSKPIGRHGKGGKNYQVIFIDYGNTDSFNETELFYLPDEATEISPQAMECMLSEVQPSLVLNPRAIWTDQANRDFDHYTRNIILTGRIYSVVNGVVHLELFRSNNVQQKPINEWLIEKGYAQKAEESYLSKENHLKRIQAQTAEKGVLKMEDENMYEKVIKDVAPPLEEQCSIKLDLKGPFSPLEMRIYATVQSGIDKAIKIEGNSVNTVLLDSDPQDPHERLVVAAQVGQNAAGNTLILRHTTVMPNIHGFPMLMTLLFCPVMECKPTEDGTKVGAVLCGLGAHEYTNRPLYPPHDLVLILDTELNVKDLDQINILRYWMNTTLKTMEDLHEERIPSIEIGTCQKELKFRLFELLKMSRKDTDLDFVKYANKWGRLLYDAEKLQPGDDDRENVIWPLHSFIKLNSDGKQQAQVKQNLTEMEDMARRVIKENTITCKACDATLYNFIEVRRHLTLESHKAKVASMIDQ